MANVKLGDSVKVHYTGKLKDGFIFDTTEKSEPIAFKWGEGKIITGFEEALVGMAPGDKKTIEIVSEKAYGPHRKELVAAVEKKNFPEDLELEVGRQLKVKQPDGSEIVVMVIDIAEENVTLDANHPLAGKDLIFDIELVEIV